MGKKSDGKFSGDNWELEQWMRTHEISLEEKYDLEHTPRRRKKGASRRKIDREPEAVLDLHGLTVEEALSELRSFVLGCKLKGCYLAKIIHGKGLHSQGEAKLRTLVNDYLNREAKNMISSWQVAPLNQGGEGAVLLYF